MTDAADKVKLNGGKSDDVKPQTNAGSEDDRLEDRTDMEIKKKSSGRVVVVSAPSGAGKTSITHRLLERHPDWRFSVSATTRSRRANEQDGVDYHFLTAEEFRSNIDNGEMVEWEEIYGNLYGTMRRGVERLLADPDVRRIIFDIDVKGALSLRRAFPDEAVLIFIAPPSMEELEARLSQRKTESPESIARRIARAEMEMALQREFDCVVVNDRIERAVEEVEECLGKYLQEGTGGER